MTTATWTKLRSGDWGLRIAGTVRKGEAVMAIRKDGRTEQVAVDRIVWSGNGITLATVAGRRSHSGHSGRRACITGGNCSSFGSGRSCGGYDCDGYPF
jgi:hypothetical protein